MKHMPCAFRSFRAVSIFIALVAGAASGGYPAASRAAGNGSDVGLGLAWQPTELAGNVAAANTGYVTLRSWVTDKLGVDAGLGMGLRSVSGPTAFQLNMSLEPMYALKRWHTSVFYADAQLIPAILTGGGTTFLFSSSAGVGVEAALPGLDDVRWYAQLNPVSIDYSDPPGPGSTVAFDFLGANMPVAFGLHYYF